MAVKTIAGAQVNVSEEGYLEDMDQWNESIAKEIADEIGIELTDKHFEVLNYLREKTGAGCRREGHGAGRHPVARS